VINVLKNPYVDAIAHPGNPQFPLDIEKVVRAAKENGKFIELNNHSFVTRKGLRRIAKNLQESVKSKESE